MEGGPADENDNTPFDVVGPDGTIYRFSVKPVEVVPGVIEPEDVDPKGVHFLEYIIPPGCTLGSSATTKYSYTVINDRKYVTKIENGDGTRPVPPVATDPANVTAVSAGGQTWTIGTDANGWIASVVPPGEKGKRGYEWL